MPPTAPVRQPRRLAIRSRRSCRCLACEEYSYAMGSDGHELLTEKRDLGEGFELSACYCSSEQKGTEERLLIFLARKLNDSKSI